MNLDPELDIRYDHTIEPTSQHVLVVVSFYVVPPLDTSARLLPYSATVVSSERSRICVLTFF